MPLPLIFFFLSLVGIIVMIWRELVLMRSGQVMIMNHQHPFVLDLQKIKRITFKSIKRFIYVTLYVIFRFFIRFSKFIKTMSKIFIKELKYKFKKNKNNLSREIAEKKEASKYLRVISEYRYKIRQIKHRIKEEEGIE